MTGTLKVSSEQLMSTADSFSTAASNVSNVTTEMVNKITGLSSSWEGEASQAYTQKFKSLETDIQKIISMIREHVSDLQQMAQAYAQAEQSNQSDASSLRTSVIS